MSLTISGFRRKESISFLLPKLFQAIIYCLYFQLSQLKGPCLLNPACRCNWSCDSWRCTCLRHHCLPYPRKSGHSSTHHPPAPLPNTAGWSGCLGATLDPNSPRPSHQSSSTRCHALVRCDNSPRRERPPGHRGCARSRTPPSNASSRGARPVPRSSPRRRRS